MSQPHVEKAPENETGSRPISARSKFDVNYNLAGTYRFGEIGVCYVQDTVPDSDVPLMSGHDIRSFNLKAPLLGQIKAHKEFYDVPLTVLLPMHYDKVFTQPQNGEDVDASLVGLNVQGFDFYIARIASKWFESIVDAIATSEVVTSAEALSLLKFFISFERFYSKGCLLSSLGVQLGSTFEFGFDHDVLKNRLTFDKAFDKFFNWFFFGAADSLYVLTIDGKNFDLSDTRFTPWQIIEILRDASVISLSGDDRSIPDWLISSTLGNLKSISSAPASAVDGKPLSLARCMAYQAVCAEFYTNSHVDYMYSAQLWRQFLADFYDNATSSVFPARFTLNGVSYEYDYCSAYYVKTFLSTIIQSGAIVYDTWQNHFIDWSRLIFGYNRSLRYVDYFTGSRTRPLAVGDVNVQVAGGYVNVVDTITKRWYAKFLNQVNRFQRKLSDYSRALFPGLLLSRDYHDPMWLAHVEDYVNSPEVEGSVAAENTKEQNTTTSVLRSNGDRYAFEYHTQYNGICIGVLYFDIKRYYTDIIERPNFWVDRNDYFNPFLQFVGDQVIFKDELNAKSVHSGVFGYQGRNQELKQRVDQCFGGFAEEGTLPGWLFIAPKVGESDVQSPDYIRSKPSELTPFFSSLTAFDLSDYFHFIVINRNNCPLNAPMVKNPQLD